MYLAMLYIELAIVAILIVINGLLAMSELAIVSSRPARLKTLADRDVAGARRALALASDPGRFLSTVQIGITLVGVLSGAFSGATLGLRLTEWMTSRGMGLETAEILGVFVVVAVITYASLIIGELVPKQIALRDPETVAARVAPAMTLLAKIAKPLVWFLDVSGRGILFLLGQKGPIEETVTEEEIHSIIADAESAGVLVAGERQMISGVMRLSDRTVRGIMTPRTDVAWLNMLDSEETIRNVLINATNTRLPVSDGKVDSMVGVIQARDLLAALLAGKPLNIADHMREAPVIHDNADALAAVALLRTSAVPMALVHDEYGHFEGIVTPADLLETIAGVFDHDDDSVATQKEDGSWVLAGYIPADEVAERLHITLPEDRTYETLGGFLLAAFRRLPQVGEHIDILNWRFEIVALDGRRIDKVLASKQAASRRERAA